MRPHSLHVNVTSNPPEVWKPSVCLFIPFSNTNSVTVERPMPEGDDFLFSKAFVRKAHYHIARKEWLVLNAETLMSQSHFCDGCGAKIKHKHLLAFDQIPASRRLCPSHCLNNENNNCAGPGCRGAKSIPVSKWVCMRTFVCLHACVCVTTAVPHHAAISPPH